MTLNKILAVTLCLFILLSAGPVPALAASTSPRELMEPDEPLSAHENYAPGETYRKLTDERVTISYDFWRHSSGQWRSQTGGHVITHADMDRALARGRIILEKTVHRADLPTEVVNWIAA